MSHASFRTPPSAFRVLVTGVSGLIGGAVYKRLTAQPERYDVWGLSRRAQPSERVAEGDAVRVPDDRFVQSDLSDLTALARAFDGIGCVVHMAADPSGAGGWESVLHSNIIGNYNVFEACRLAGVARIVFASTIQVSVGYRREPPYVAIAEGRFQDLPDPVPAVTADMPTRPLNIYASSKVWSEGLARSYADVHGLSCLGIRIGWVVAEDRVPRPEMADIWCSRRDIVNLIECCINAPEDLRYDIFYGMSDNAHRWVDVAHAREAVGYEPQDRAEDLIS